MKKVELIFVPTPGVGHLVTTGEFTKHLIHSDDRISVTILSMKWFSATLPVRNAVMDIMSVRSTSDSASARVAGLVLDLFVPPCLVFEYPKPETRNGSSTFDPRICKSCPSRVLPSFLFTRMEAILHLSRLVKSSGMPKNPPTYPVQPVNHLNSLPHVELDQVQRDRIMKWLDSQLESSVVYLCFGSMGSHGPPQVKEIALGLEQSEHKFLWSLHMPPPLQSQDDAAGNVHYKSPEEMLPEGFLERIQGRGLICGWAPQVEDLRHKAVGGLVSLRLELNSGELVVWCAYSNMAYMTSEVVTADEIKAYDRLWMQVRLGRK
ncbi:hypothetical protein F3Y22_tig00002793pilonHSYRG00134 [Hibiscus syriacus]|uniref:Uncharacterized protein n=1 Tax=Hibiscus syriacus TaxID=106335 RepID=A0A6A3CRL7_HIBSY|nr:hypothetical protein F3Y22_tig00002793pilonHSYRG00134 [Hibiscus syriacus]